MGIGSLTASNWTVSTRQDGEVLAVWAGGGDLQLGVFATREGFSQSELDGWLKDLVSVARESARGDLTLREIPALLHHALTGLLFSHAELWERAGGTYFSAALVSIEGLVGIGWVGEADLRVHLNGLPQEVDWLLIRDSEAREARAATFEASEPLRLWISWNPGMDEESGVAVDAAWTPETAPAASQPILELTADDLAPAADPDLEEEADESARDEEDVEPQASRLSDDFVPGPEFTPPRNPSPSPIREAFDLDRYGLGPFEDASEVAPEAPSEHEVGEVERELEPPAEDAPQELEEAPQEEEEHAPTTAEEPAIAAAEPEATSTEPEHEVPAEPEPELASEVPAPAEAQAPDMEINGPEVEAKPIRQGGMWDRVASLWQKKGKRAPDLELPQVEATPPQEPAAEHAKEAAPPAAEHAKEDAPAAATPAPERPAAEAPVAEAPKPDPAPEPAAEKPVRNEWAATQLPSSKLKGLKPAPAEADPRPARLVSKTSKPAAPPEEKDDEAKPAALPEERLGPLARTSPARPSLSSAPAAPSEEVAPAPPEPTPPVKRAPTAEAAPSSPPAVAPALPTAETAPSAPPAVAPAAPSAPKPDEPMSIVPVGEPTAEPKREPRAATQKGEADAPATPPAKARATGQAGARAPIRAQWPSEDEMVSPAARIASAVVGVSLVAVMFAIGWLVGGHVPDRSGSKPAGGSWLQMLENLPFMSGHYHVAITSDPDGASIAVDGKDFGKRTPATIDLSPGAHQVTLSYPDLGSATFGVRGLRDQSVPLYEPLWGRLGVEQDNPDVPVSVTVDGRDLGFAPVTMDSVPPGAHEVRFSGPGMTPWAQTVAVKVRESARIVAHPMVSPATGVLSIRASLNDERGSAPLAGGEVWLDAELVGRTPLTLELPRGPHSVKVVYGQEAAPVQVIDLPGGNQRFAQFQLGTGAPDVRLVPVSVATRVLADQPALVSAGIDGVGLSDVREMWLHVRGPDDNWRRYALNVMKTPAGIVGVTTFPLGVFDENGLTKYYLSALLITGDEYFTEITSAQLVTGGAAGSN